MNPARQRRRHRSRAEKQQFVEEWTASGLSSRAYAEQTGLCSSNLWRWKRELAESTAASWVPVVVRSEPGDAIAATPPSAHLELVARGGRVLRVFSGCEPELLRVVLAIAEEAAPC
jgi:transposase-like protein